MKTAVIIPTRNACPWLSSFIPALKAQEPAPDDILVIDSASEDNTAEIFDTFGIRVHSIPVEQFSHGGTRRLGTEMIDADIYVFLTQDAILTDPGSIARLAAPFNADPQIGMIYGRQLPHPDAGPIATHARLFNYPDVPRTKTLADASELGIKTCFASDAFCAYRADALREVGNFPAHVIGTEETHVAARMLKAGWKLRYEAGATVYHSHDYRLSEQFRRYFDIGVFYGRETWIHETFGDARREGRNFVESELHYLRKTGNLHLIPYALLQTAAKWLGYRLGLEERRLPSKLKPWLSMNRHYWRMGATA